MQINRITLDRAVLLAVQGQLDATTARAFDDALQQELQAGVTCLVVDFGQVQLISSVALRVLVTGAKQMKKQGGHILLCAMNPEVSKVLSVSGLSSLFNLHPTRADALAALGVDAPEPPAPTSEVSSPEPGRPVSLVPVETPSPPPATPAPLQIQEPAAAAPPTPPRALAPSPVVAAPPPSASASVKRIVPPPPPFAAPPLEPVASPFVEVNSSSSPIAQMITRLRLDRLAEPRLAAIAAGAFVLLLLCVIGLQHQRTARVNRREASATMASPTPLSPRTDSEGMTTPPVAANPTPTPAPELPPASTPPMQGLGEAAPESVSVPPKDSIRLDGMTAEDQQMHRAVLQRIDVMPILPAQRDALYRALDRVRGMAKIATIRFGTGRTELNGAAIDSLKTALRRADIQAILADPEAQFVVLGFADPTGTPQSNKETSEHRAASAMAALRGPCGMVSVMHAIGMGGSDFLDKEHLAKNRVVEVWAVRP